MRQHDAFGKPGRAGGIDQGSDTLRNFGVDCFRFDFIVEWPIAIGPKLGRFLDDCAMPLRVFSGMGRHARGVDDPPGATVIPNLIDFARRETCVDQHRPCIELG